MGLGTVWILDGLEVTIVGAVGSTITKADSGITITTAQIGDAAGVYVAGACVGALLFGHLTDRLGRRSGCSSSPSGVYLVATLLTATSHDAWMFFAFRFFTGMGIGGEYAAINSAIDELIPARVRGTVDLLVNGSYWLGTAAGAAATLVLLDPNLLALDLGWRLCFFIGAVLGLGVLFVRRNLPESPRWLFTHGKPERGRARSSTDIERQVRRSTGQDLADPGEAIERPRAPGGRNLSRSPGSSSGSTPGVGPRPVALRRPGLPVQRRLLHLLARAHDLLPRVRRLASGYYLIAFAVGNFLGPLLLGRSSTSSAGGR